ncbi:GNAT family N-acetyltransferase [Ktedonobacter robiniae]|uniref:N-acetyltransferase domain-containing protein n=1 Tax=Ktedonobacter robiniae TaxID=2778365 RepID=A0ABQ3UXJ6_9CHLR|nr:hypothetical protein [Ktedonobacter robiniae]GHO57110.1 hypothetical protein KSB_55850 [Ktedonobacter robiniae]
MVELLTLRGKCSPLRSKAAHFSGHLPNINTLLAQGEKELVLFVTVGNDAAQHIYQKLGFQIEEEFETNLIKPV